MRFATTMEGLGVALIDSVMTLIAFLPVLLPRCRPMCTVLPLRRARPILAGVRGSRLVDLRYGAAWWWSGIKLPGLEFRNQRVEAAYRKELVYGEDDADRAAPADGAGALRECA